MEFQKIFTKPRHSYQFLLSGRKQAQHGVHYPRILHSFEVQLIKAERVTTQQTTCVSCERKPLVQLRQH